MTDARVREKFVEALCLITPENVGETFTCFVEQVFPEILPEFLENIDVPQNNRYHEFPVDEHIALVVALVPPTPALRLAALLHDIGKARCFTEDVETGIHFYDHEYVGAEIALDFMTRMGFDAELTDRVVRLVRNHMRDFDCGNRGIRGLIRNVVDVREWCQLKLADRLGGHVLDENFEEQFRNFIDRVNVQLNKPTPIPLPINGEQIMEKFNLEPGRLVGIYLMRVRELVENNPEITVEEIWKHLLAD